MIDKKQILIVDDETPILHTLASSLEDEGYVVNTLDDGKKTVDTIGKIVPDLILLDISMPGCNGLEILADIKKNYPSQIVIMISGYGTIPVAIEALKNGASDFIEKPLNLDDILSKIETLTQNTNQKYHDKASALIDSGIQGASALFCELMNHVNLIAPLTTPLILYGPQGSGRSLIARYVHTKSLVSTGRCIEFNCTTQQLLQESDIPQSGSFIVKNINELSEQGQRTLLKGIESQKELRIIATAQPNLFSMVQQGTFSASLFCKLNATPCEVPPLVKRRYDIPLLINHFTTAFNTQHSYSKQFSSNAIRILRNYNWIGDVAELKNIVTQVLTISSSTIIDAQELLIHLPERASILVDEQLYSRFSSLDQATETFQRGYLNHLLKRHNYNTLQLAEFLQIPVAQLSTTMTKLRIRTHP